MVAIAIPINFHFIPAATNIVRSIATSEMPVPISFWRTMTNSTAKPSIAPSGMSVLSRSLISPCCIRRPRKLAVKTRIPNLRSSAGWIVPRPGMMNQRHAPLVQSASWLKSNTFPRITNSAHAPKPAIRIFAAYLEMILYGIVAINANIPSAASKLIACLMKKKLSLKSVPSNELRKFARCGPIA
ncbi:hypothetical protein D3C72_1305560 [compost metagenome]